MNVVAHPLAAVLADAAEGCFPPADGRTDVLPPDGDGTVAVVAFSGHAFVLADVDSDEVARRATDGAGGGFGGVLDPTLLIWLAGDERTIGSIDVVLTARARGAPNADDLLPVLDVVDHPRVRRAFAHRRHVEVRGDDRGVVVLGRGLVGRRELSLELFDGTAMSTGAGRDLITRGLAAVPAGEWCWAQVAAGNTRSLRAFSAAGFRPVCAEVLLPPARASGESAPPKRWPSLPRTEGR
ncbi:GNAT family N-acetyltransferase [soil metagenome]